MPGETPGPETPPKKVFKELRVLTHEEWQRCVKFGQEADDAQDQRLKDAMEGRAKRPDSPSEEAEQATRRYAYWTTPCKTPGCARLQLVTFIGPHHKGHTYSLPQDCWDFWKWVCEDCEQNYYLSPSDLKVELLDDPPPPGFSSFHLQAAATIANLHLDGHQFCCRVAFREMQPIRKVPALDV
jgi:hypothetical protein